MSKFAEYWTRSSKKLGVYSPERYRYYGGAKSIPADHQQWAMARTGKFARLWQLGLIARGKKLSAAKQAEYLAEMPAIVKLLSLVRGTRWECTVLSEMGECYIAFGDKDAGVAYLYSALVGAHSGDGEAYHAAEVLWGLGDTDPIKTALA